MFSFLAFCRTNPKEREEKCGKQSVVKGGEIEKSMVIAGKFEAVVIIKTSTRLASGTLLADLRISEEIPRKLWKNL